MSARLLIERIDGTGVGQMLGVLRSLCLITVDKEVAQAASTITGTNLITMASRCWGYGDPSSIWLANHDALPQLTAAVDANGEKVLTYATTDRGPAFFILGRPLFLTEFCPTLGTVGDVILGVWSEYLDGTYEPVRGVSSVHVRFIEDEKSFKFWTRLDGAPWWNSVLTPRIGAATLSPFVTLAERA